MEVIAAVLSIPSMYDCDTAPTPKTDTHYSGRSKRSSQPRCG
jgi:hypothetical protein